MGAFGMHGSQKSGQMLNNATKAGVLELQDALSFFPVFSFFFSANQSATEEGTTGNANLEYIDKVCAIRQSTLKYSITAVFPLEILIPAISLRTSENPILTTAAEVPRV